MIGFFRKFLQRQGTSQVLETPEQAVQRLYRSLPKCTARLLVAGPAYKDDEYFGDVLVDANALRPWATRHAEGSYCSDPERQAAAETLPIWLRSYDALDEQPAKLPISMLENLRPYIPAFFDMGIATIYCEKCQHSYSDMVQEIRRVDEGPTHRDATHEWFCLKGHLLYRYRSHTHLVRSHH